MLQPSATRAPAPMTSPPAKSFTIVKPGTGFHANSPARHAASVAPATTPRRRTMPHVARFG